MIEHRANVHAASSFSPEVVVSINSVGSLRSDFPPGNIGLAEQTLDFTGRVWTFHDDDATHADMTSHFDSEISGVASNALLESQDSVLRLVVAQMTGPQFETSAEIEALSRMGADAVGMTLTAEAKLIAELGLRHVALSVSSNWAAGRTPGDAAAEIDHHAVEGLASKVHARLWSAIVSILAQ
jgi:5'-methylthioadenosine phosphorylase